MYLLRSWFKSSCSLLTLTLLSDNSLENSLKLTQPSQSKSATLIIASSISSGTNSPKDVANSFSFQQSMLPQLSKSKILNTFSSSYCSRLQSSCPCFWDPLSLSSRLVLSLMISTNSMKFTSFRSPAPPKISLSSPCFDPRKEAAYDLSLSFGLVLRSLRQFLRSFKSIAPVFETSKRENSL